MKRVLFILGGIIIFVVMAWIAAAATGALRPYKVASGSMEPAFKPGDLIFISNLKKPVRFSLLSYRIENPMEDNKESVLMHRVCGLPGDVVHIRKGDLYINNKFADSGLNIIHPFTLSASDYQKIRDELPEDHYLVEINDSVMVNVPAALIKRHNITASRYYGDTAYGSEWIKQKFKQNWTEYNFGPVRVPANHFFVLGDNRHASMDSRYLGFISKERFVGVVLNEK